jgi:hypothetical protein
MTRWLQRHNLQFIGIAVVAVSVVLLLTSLTTARDGRTIFGSLLGGDYAAFYVAGKILNEDSASHLYDGVLQDKLFHELLPAASPSESLPFAYPPFIALLFRPLAWLSYRWSFAAWLVFSGALSITGVWLAVRKLPAENQRLAMWLALAFEPLIMESWIGGQLSAIGLCAVALGLERDRRGDFFGAGLAFGVCFYKPTLLVWLVPVLIVGRQWRMLLGLAMTGIGLVCISWLVVGGSACRAYADVLSGYLRMTAGTPTMFRIWKFIDLRSFFDQLFHNSVSWWLTGIVAAGTAWVLLRGWMRPNRRRELLWAATLTATIVVNVYVGIYDSVLVIPSLMLAPLRPAAVLIWILPWFSQTVAVATGLQPYTLVLAGLFIYQLVLLRRDSLQSPA